MIFFLFLRVTLTHKLYMESKDTISPSANNTKEQSLFLKIIQDEFAKLTVKIRVTPYIYVIIVLGINSV